MTGGVVVIGVGNTYRRDDGVGPAVAAEIAECDLPGVRVVTVVDEPIALLDAWAGAALAVIIDAGVAAASTPGRVRRFATIQSTSSGVLSSHGWGIPEMLELGRALERTPQELVVFTVDAADTGHGPGLTPDVAGAVPKVVAAVLAELRGRRSAGAPVDFRPRHG
jgi:hydrogenase maturation protease